MPISVLFLSVRVLFDGAFFHVSILNLDVSTINKVIFGGKILRYYRPKFLNLLAFHIKSSENLEAFILQKTGMVFLASARGVNIIKC